MKYGIVIFPPKEVQDRANNLRKRYDSHYNLIAPHMTIKEAFEFENEEEMIKHIEKVTQTTPPFTVNINKIKTFLPTSPVVFFAIEENPFIYKLHDELNSRLLSHEEKHKFIPHITIAQDLSTQELHDIHNRLKLKDFNMTFPVDRIQLCYQIENESWIAHQTFLLRGN